MGIGGQLVAAELQIQRLLSRAKLVGGIFSMGYNECLILTNDLWKRQAGGIPQHCFLLATAMRRGEAPDPDDEEVVLLRVIGPAPLAAEARLLEVRQEAMREMLERRGADGAAAAPAILDVLTRNEIQFSGIKAKVLGTFYDSDSDGRSLLAFGSDIESFYSSSRYLVYKPYAESLELIACYPELPGHDVQQGSETSKSRLRLGTLRYSSSSRRTHLIRGSEGDTAVPVRVNIEDFISMKTAVFGMTRLGKSNTMKTIATAVTEYAAEHGVAIGQLLFDPAGEYANVNVQDQTALAVLGSEFVTIFRYGADGSQPGVRPLTLNFYSEDVIEVVWSMIRAFLASHGRDAIYLQSFMVADVIGPQNPDDDRSAYTRAHRRRAALYATLRKADFAVPDTFSISVAVNRDVLMEINAQSRGDPFTTDPHGNLSLTAKNLVPFWDAVNRAREAGGHHIEEWMDEQLAAILTVFRGSVGAGYRVLQPLRVYHSLSRSDDYASEVLSELVAGKIVIIDLSLGTETVLKFVSERIINHILQDSARRFADGQEMRRIQIFIEEAHRLFNRDRMNAPAEADPYVRLAKEAAKYKIGLIYATQEVTSVDPMILSNTSNWIVAHLNNAEEVKTLGRYYDFSDFSELTLKAEDVGFVRLKCRSGRYIVPVQVDLFDRSLVQSARERSKRARSERDGTV